MEIKKENTQITNIKNETGNITTGPIDIERIIGKHYKQLHAQKSQTQNKWTNSPKTTSYQNSDKIKLDNLNSPISV